MNIIVIGLLLSLFGVSAFASDERTKQCIQRCVDGGGKASQCWYGC